MGTPRDTPRKALQMGDLSIQGLREENLDGWLLY